MRTGYTLRKLTPALSFLALVACAPLQTVTPDSRAQTMTTLQAGEISLDCTMACSWNWVTERERLRAFDAAGDWESLALKVAQIGYQKDLAYYYLGRASEGLGYRDAALRYYRESFALATGNLRGPQCRAVAGDCMGVDLLAVLPGKLNPSRPVVSSAKQSSTTQGQAVETAKSKQMSRPLSADSTSVRAASAAGRTTESNIAQTDAVCRAFNRIDAAAAEDFRAIVPPSVPLPKDDVVDVPTQVPGTMVNSVAIRPSRGAIRPSSSVSISMPVDVPGPVDTRTTKRYYKHWIETVIHCFPTAQRKTITNRHKSRHYSDIIHHEVFTLPSGNQFEVWFREPLISELAEGGSINLSLWKGIIPAEMLTDSESLPTASSTGAGTASSVGRAPSDNKGATSGGGSSMPDKISIDGKNNQKIMVNNFFPKGDPSSGHAEIVANNGKMWIDYGPRVEIASGKTTLMFSILIGGQNLKEVQKNQKDAEGYLLKTLDIDKNSACKLDLMISAPKSMTGRFDYSIDDTFSFCPDGQLLHREVIR
jgi:tetratricopeptide (TPR) repeat protein